MVCQENQSSNVGAALPPQTSNSLTRKLEHPSVHPSHSGAVVTLRLCSSPRRHSNELMMRLTFFSLTLGERREMSLDATATSRRSRFIIVNTAGEAADGGSEREIERGREREGERRERNRKRGRERDGGREKKRGGEKLSVPAG